MVLGTDSTPEGKAVAFWKICCDRYTYYPGAEKWLIFAAGPLLLLPLTTLAAKLLVLVRRTL